MTSTASGYSEKPYAESPPEWIRAILYRDVEQARQRDDEERLGGFGPESSYPFSLPVDPFEAARLAGASAAQLRQAEELWRLGLKVKAKRQACCSVFGDRLDCSSTECGRRYYRTYRCHNRYCLICGPAVYGQLFSKYIVLDNVVHGILSTSPGYVVAKLDLTTKKSGRMPSPVEVRQFNAAIKCFFRSLARELGVKPKKVGLLYCDEFGSENCNLHAHCVYLGPKIPHKWFGKDGRLSEMWGKACKGGPFDGSFIVSAKKAVSFGQALAHSLKYTGKVLDVDLSKEGQTPDALAVRLATLEWTFHRVRRVHGLGLFYNALPPQDKDEPTDGELSCPMCGSAVVRDRVLSAVVFLKKEGRVDFDEVRRNVKRDKAFARDG
jgi:hypothetical protein